VTEFTQSHKRRLRPSIKGANRGAFDLAWARLLKKERERGRRREYLNENQRESFVTPVLPYLAELVLHRPLSFFRYCSPVLAHQ